MHSRPESMYKHQMSFQKCKLNNVVVILCPVFVRTIIHFKDYMRRKKKKHAFLLEHFEAGKMRPLCRLETPGTKYSVT